MSTSELKQKLITCINHIDNENLLQEVFRLLELETESLEVYKPTAEQKQSIITGQEDIKAGNSSTNEEADDETSISSEQYNKEIDDTMNQMDNGEFIPHQQVVERSEKWVNGS